MADFSKHKFGTKAIHAGADPDPSTGAIMTPIFQTSTYVQESPGTNKGYGYARGKNPTRDALQKNIAALENGKHCVCFSSGMGATDAVMRMLRPGDEVITGDDLYGGKPFMLSSVKRNYRLSKEQEEQPIMKRFALHARAIGFKLADGTTISIEAPYPKDFDTMLKMLQKFDV